MRSLQVTTHPGLDGYPPRKSSEATGIEDRMRQVIKPGFMWLKNNLEKYESQLGRIIIPYYIWNIKNV